MLWNPAHPEKLIRLTGTEKKPIKLLNTPD